MIKKFDELIKFVIHPIFFIPFMIILLIEFFLRTGAYNLFLKPQSYAANVLHIKEVIKNSHIKPEVLIVGTSIPYQGLLIHKLNEYSSSYQFQSIATQGAFLETQYSLLKYTLKNRKETKYIIHFVDIDFPWQQKKILESFNRTMLAQFEVFDILNLLKDFKYDLTLNDYAFFYIKIVQYHSDIKDFLLNPLNRFKSLKRYKQKLDTNFVYANNLNYSIAVYGNTIEDCINNAKKGIPFINNKKISDEPHRKAVLDTCLMSKYDHYLAPEKFFSEKLYEMRIQKFYNFILKKNFKLITIVPPYSLLAPNLRSEEKFLYIKNLFSKIDKNIILIDMRKVLDDDNNLEYFYDTIHLNHYGAEKFTEIFYKTIKDYL